MSDKVTSRVKQPYAALSRTLDKKGRFGTDMETKTENVQPIEGNNNLIFSFYL